MTISISISSEAESRLRAKAAAVGKDVAAFVEQVVERLARGHLDLKELSGPISEDFRRSGMTDEELTEFLEAEKHAMRAERRGRQGQ